MGAHWLHDFPAEAAARGLTVQTYPGWELRSRASGGFDGIWGVVMHHTASPSSWSSAQDQVYVFKSAPLAPISSLYLGRAGDIVLGAAGAANHAGVGGPYQTSKGYIGADQANRYMIGIEAANNGVGEKWSTAQVNAYDRLLEVICDVYGLNPQQDIILHNTWAPNRKIDPAGPTPSRPAWGGTSGARTWSLPAVRNDIGAASEDQDMRTIKPTRVYDSRNSGGPFGAGEVRRVPVALASEAQIGGGVTGGRGWWAYSPDGDFSDPSSFVNLIDDGNWYSWGAIPVLCPGGHIYVKSLGGGHIYIDTYATKA